MPRLSLYRPERGQDYYFIDKQIYEMFTVGGTDIHVHKYLGPKDPEESSPSQPKYDILSETNIQDLLFLENRDRKYDEHIYRMRGIYNVQDLDFDLTQFALFLSNDTVFMTIHITSSVKTLGRKIMSGDVIELPHLKDEYALNDFDIALKRFYVVEDVNRAAEGFSPTWYPHLYRLKLKQIHDSDEFADILDQPASEDSDYTLRDLMSTYNKEMDISNAIVEQGDEDAPLSGFEMSHYYTVARDEDGTYSLMEIDDPKADINDGLGSPRDRGYSGYLVFYGDNEAINGYPFGIGEQFPVETHKGDYFLRTDLVPNRMFRYDGEKWTRMYDGLRMTLSNYDERTTQRMSFVNNKNTNEIGGEEVQERQWARKALRPRADN